MIRKIISAFGRRIVRSADYDYELNFNEAIANTEGLGLQLPQFDINSDETYKRDDLLDIANETVFCYPIELVAGRCHQMAPLLSQAINEKLGIKSVVTCGYLIGNRNGGDISKIFYEPYFLLKKRIGKNNNFTFPIHCWVTLPNMGIIDPTILSTLKGVGSPQHMNLDYRQCYVIGGKAQQPNSEFAYQPVLVGTEFIERLNLPIFAIQFQ